jgi:ATP-dependent Clp protease protease subunit
MSSTISLPQPKERNLFLAQQVDQSSINSLSKDIIAIEEDDEYLQKIYNVHGINYVPKPIKIYIDSYGGAVYQCLGLLGIIKACKTPIHTIVTGCAMSCGFLISITGHKRFGYPKSTYLYHQVSSVSWGKAKDIEEDFAETMRLQSIIEEHTIEHTKIPKKKLEKIFKSKKDWFMNTEEALKLHVIDEVIK